MDSPLGTTVEEPQGIHGIDPLRACLAEAPRFRAAVGRPFVVLSYAQSVNGSIAGPKRERVRFSGPESMHLTHYIRMSCDAILVGIGTVLADDPQLTVKAGRSPRPVVLDTHLRTPVRSRLIERRDTHAWLIHGPDAPAERLAALRQAGAEPLDCPTAADGRIDLHELLRRLAQRSVDSVMVEGGARVITNFIRHRLADLFVITISPQMLGGLPVIDAAETDGAFGLHFTQAAFKPLGRDVILWARPRWGQA
jgi:3,4-dihydroxy 2-butanone 4-phosphate synthase/GTP cyclohydrolase II